MPWRFNIINLYLGVTECIFLTAHDLLPKQIQNTLFPRGESTHANSQNFLGWEERLWLTKESVAAQSACSLQAGIRVL